MKKISILFLVCLLLASFAFAAVEQKNDNEDKGMSGNAQPVVTKANIQENEPGDQDTMDAMGLNNNEMNQGEDSQIQNNEQVQNQVLSGAMTTPNGKTVQVTETAQNRVELKVGDQMAQTGLAISKEDNGQGATLRAELSNGKNAEIKVMPDAASEQALERLRIKVCSEENNCQIELKEVKAGSEVKAAYEVQLERHSRILGIFSKKMEVSADIDAETGDVLATHKPWWAFLAAEPAE